METIFAKMDRLAAEKQMCSPVEGTQQAAEGSLANHVNEATLQTLANAFDHGKEVPQNIAGSFEQKRARIQLQLLEIKEAMDELIEGVILLPNPTVCHNAAFVDSCYTIVKRAHEDWLHIQSGDFATEIAEVQECLTAVIAIESFAAKTQLETQHGQLWIEAHLADCVSRIMALSYARGYCLPERILQRLEDHSSWQKIGETE
jgi:hypothetical protein